MRNTLRITLAMLFLATITMSQCPGDADDAPNCQTCNDDDNTLCDVCADNYQLEDTFLTPGNCRRCPGANCLACFIDDFCTEFDDAACTEADELLDLTGNTCVECNIGGLLQPCERCNFPNTCARCNFGFTMTAGGQCTPCDVDLCTQCDPDDPLICNQCLGGNIQDTGFPSPVTLNTAKTQCVPCSLTVVGCARCEQQDVCAECNSVDGVVFRLNEDGDDCVPCPNENCQTCNEGNVCIACQADNIPENEDIDNCYPCADTTNCKFCNSDAKCTECNDINGNVAKTDAAMETCYECPDENCMFCSDDNTCETCIEGYEPNGSGVCELTVTPVECPEDCEGCSVDNVCDECSDEDEKPTPIFGECEECKVPGCASCWCNGRCARCQDDDYKPSGLRTICVRCRVEHCLKCNSTDRCVFCEFGYRVAGSNCIKRI